MHKLHLPTVDDLADLIIKHGEGCYIYTQDLARAYGQLRTDPLDWPLLGIRWQDSWWTHCSVPFGVRWGCFQCQRMTNALCFLANREGRDVLAYVDDFAGVADDEAAANREFQANRNMFSEMGVDEAVNKEQLPGTRRQWIGIIFDTVKMAMEIPEEKLCEIKELMITWKGKAAATKHELQIVLGKLHFISRCCKPGRLFVSRMLNTLKASPTEGRVKLSSDFQKDITWFASCMPLYNGIELIGDTKYQFTLEADSCLTGGGAISGAYCYAKPYPASVTAAGHHISRLELLNVVVALKLWSTMYQGSTVKVYCDNSAAVALLQNGKGHDDFMVSCAREAWLTAVTGNFRILPQHRPGEDMGAADSLSREHLTTGGGHTTHALPPGLKRVTVADNLFCLNDEI